MCVVVLVQPLIYLYLHGMLQLSTEYHSFQREAKYSVLYTLVNSILLWVEFHQPRINQNDKLHKLWKELVQQLKVTDDNPLLKQSVYRLICSISE